MRAYADCDRHPVGCDAGRGARADQGQGHPALESDHARRSPASSSSPAGKTDWGPNQTLNDKDKEVDHDERLRITGVEPGRYDAKVSYPDARQCVVRDIEIKADAVFSIADKDLKDCTK